MHLVKVERNLIDEMEIEHHTFCPLKYIRKEMGEKNKMKCMFGL